MNIPVLLEPIPTGFRASTGAPLNLTAEAPTADEAVAGIRGAVIAKLAIGAKVGELDVPTPSRLHEHIAKLAANPFLDEWTAATTAYRAEYEAEEAVKDAAAEAAEQAKAEATKAPSTRQQQEPVHERVHSRGWAYGRDQRRYH